MVGASLALWAPPAPFPYIGGPGPHSGLRGSAGRAEQAEPLSRPPVEPVLLTPGPACRRPKLSSHENIRSKCKGPHGAWWRGECVEGAQHLGSGRPPRTDPCPCLRRIHSPNSLSMHVVLDGEAGLREQHTEAAVKSFSPSAAPRAHGIMSRTLTGARCCPCSCSGLGHSQGPTAHTDSRTAGETPRP